MELTHEDVLEILELLEHSSVDYLELDVGGTRIVADRNGTSQEHRSARELPVTPARPAGPAEEPASSEGASVEPAAPPETGRLVTVTAPVVGVFYRSPEPGAPPFTDVGEEVAEDSTVGLVEVMKMFNGVTAGVRGRVADILVANETFVEYGQALMTIRPEDTV